MSAEAAASKRIVPLARIVAIAQTGVEPDLMGTGPISAVESVVSIIENDFQPYVIQSSVYI